MHFILGRTFMSISVCGIEKTQFSPIFVTLGTRSRIQVFTTSRQSRLPFTLGKTNQISENSTFFQKIHFFHLFSLFYRFVEHLVETDLPKSPVVVFVERGKRFGRGWFWIWRGGKTTRNGRWKVGIDSKAGWLWINLYKEWKNKSWRN